MFRKVISGFAVALLVSVASGANFQALLYDGFSDGNALTAGGQTVWDQFNPSGNCTYDTTAESRDVDDLGYALNIKGPGYNQVGGIVSKQTFTLSQDTLRLETHIKNITADNTNARGDLYVSLMSSNTGVTAGDLAIRINGWMNTPGIHALSVAAAGATLGSAAHDHAYYSHVRVDLDDTNYALYIGDMDTAVAQGAHGLADTEGLYLGLYFQQTTWNYYYWLNSNMNGAYFDSVAVSQVPEPATLGLLAIGGLTGAVRRRRRLA